MRLLFVSNLYPPHHIGGYEMFCRYTAEGLRERGHQVRILTSSFDSGPQDDGQVGRSLTCVYRPPDFFPDAPTEVAAANARLLVEEIRETRPDVVSLWNLHGLGYLRLHHAALGAAPQVATRFGDAYFWPDWDQSRPMPPENVALLRDPRLRCSVNARTLAARFVRDGVPADRLALLGPWAERVHESLPPEPVPPPPLRLLFAGRIGGRKGIEVAVEGVRILVGRHRVPAELDVVGDGEQELLARCVTRAAEPAGTASAPFSLRYLGTLAHRQLLARMADYHAVLVPTLVAEPVGAVCLEAMDAGAAVVASRLEGLVETTREGRAGLLFEPGDPVDLARQLRRLAADRQLWRRLRVEGRRHIEANYTRKVVLDRYEAFLTACSQGLPVSRMPASVPTMSSPLPAGRLGPLRRLFRSLPIRR